MKKETKVIIINDNKIREAIGDAMNYNLSGWRLPVFVEHYDSEKELIEAFRTEDEIELELSIGSWMSSNSWQPGAIEICSVERWECECSDDDPDCDHEYRRDEILDKIIENQIRENFIYELNESMRNFDDIDFKFIVNII